MVNIHLLNQCFLNSYYMLSTGLWASWWVGMEEQKERACRAPSGQRVWGRLAGEEDSRSSVGESLDQGK